MGPGVLSATSANGHSRPRDERWFPGFIIPQVRHLLSVCFPCNVLLVHAFNVLLLQAELLCNA